MPKQEYIINHQLDLLHNRFYEPIPVKFFVNFRNYFGRFSIKILGVIYRCRAVSGFLLRESLKPDLGYASVGSVHVVDKVPPISSPLFSHVFHFFIVKSQLHYIA